MFSTARHKPGQGKGVRLTALGFLVFMCLFGCYELYWNGPDSLYTVVLAEIGKRSEDVVKALVKLDPDAPPVDVSALQPGTVIRDKLKREEAYRWKDELAGTGATIDLREAGWGELILSFKFLGRELALQKWVYVVGPIFLVLAWICWRLLQAEKIADFLIDTEGEMRKVSWPARKEFVGASMVVLFLTISVALFLWGVDELLSVGLKTLKIGY